MKQTELTWVQYLILIAALVLLLASLYSFYYGVWGLAFSRLVGFMVATAITGMMARKK